MKNRLAWCSRQKNGTRLIEPNENLASAYLKKSEEAMEAMHSVTSREWKISAGYYSLYFSLYAVMMKVGIKSENHTCTCEVMKVLLADYFTHDECDLMEEGRRARVETQYYVSPDLPDHFSGLLVKQVPRFHVKCKGISSTLNEQQIQNLREIYRHIIDHGTSSP
jgi:uncharacterized protein (UPF0332 family)